jgi:hypothetical protein
VTATNYNNINKTNNFHLKSLKTKMTMKYGFENPSLGFRTGTVGCENPTPGLGQAQLVVRIQVLGLGQAQLVVRIQVLV